MFLQFLLTSILSGCVSAIQSSTQAVPFCGQTPCKPPGKCCGKNLDACCTSSGTPWYVFLIVAIVVVAVGIGAAVAGYVCWKRRRGLNYARNI